MIVRFALLFLFCCVANTALAEDAIFATSKPKLVLRQGAGEGPAWDSKLGLLFSGGGDIWRWSRDGQLSVHRSQARSNGLLFDAQGRLLTCEPGRQRITRTDRDGKLTVLTDHYQGKHYNQPNDITVDSQGRIYFSDPCYGDRSKLEILDKSGRAVEGVYRIDLDGKVTRIITHEADRPNGLVVTADDRHLYVGDNNNSKVGGARKLWRFDLQKDGSADLDSRKLIFDWKDSRGPDGMVFDQKGRLYVAAGLNKSRAPVEVNERQGGIYVFSPQGKLLTFVHIPRDEVTNCTFGGHDLKTLYVTAGGTLWSIRATTPGQMPWPRDE